MFKKSYFVLLFVVSVFSCFENKKIGEIKNDVDTELVESTDTEIDFHIKILEAVADNNCEQILQIINSGFNINIQDSLEGYSLLLSAIYNKYTQSAKCLVDYGADINLSTLDGISPLMMAIQIKDFELVKYLIEKGADVNAKDADGQTPLSYAIFRKSAEIVKYLIQNKADVNAIFTLRNNIGDLEEKGIQKTILQFATDRGNKEIIDLLIEAGAK